MSRNRLTLPIIQQLFTSQTITPNQLLTFCHQLASQTNDTFNIFSQLTPLDQLLQHAQESTQRYAQNTPKSMIDGVPISIKANIAVKGFPLTANSNILQDNSLGYDCVLCKKLKQAGAIIVGTTNMDEFGMGSLGTHSNNGFTVNPLPFLQDISYGDYIQRIQQGNVPCMDMNMNMNMHMHMNMDEQDQHPILLSPGGSSSGSAASVSMGSSIISIGTDTGGSIRLPAAWCGVVGLKPTYGAISRDGVVSYASSLDTVGILGPSAACVGYTLDILRNVKSPSEMAGHGEDDNDNDWYHDQVKDSTACFIDPVSSGVHTHKYEKEEEEEEEEEKECKDGHRHDTLKGMNIGIPAAFSVDGCSSQVRDAWERSVDRLIQCGANVSVVSQECISPQVVKLSLPAYYVISCAEASSNLARYDGLRYGTSFVASQQRQHQHQQQQYQQREAQFAYTRSMGFGREVQRRILAGTAVLSSDRFHTHYEGATNIRAVMTKQFQNAFEHGGGSGGGGIGEEGSIDVMLIPTALSGPPMIGGKDAKPLDSTEAFQNDVMTVPISLAGLPSISVPVDSFSMVGMQIFGPRKSEGQILRVAQALHGV
eukprot:CAMPEP_0176484670 /NCGR_PEP_ID=MMETSP0200_2-20121128/4580_1 /TAXON_ID=947934 /ORGANISM="Chaetoceros sp., Strain GSL56" /LENGTH=594 /DNA_ID=CAMNT_0017881163 /DNA_START=157 /DNA_END=1941 /DNA_ORIENTATION=-